jgi:hypothetical protein
MSRPTIEVVNVSSQGESSKVVIAWRLIGCTLINEARVKIQTGDSQSEYQVIDFVNKENAPVKCS